ncbi:hypothetical protein C8Q78DRAFT_712712 [Trametes maxima]|nr:hypothetical protein C8Q78DRAFT_712712 [Trametes maxima]
MARMLGFILAALAIGRAPSPTNAGLRPQSRQHWADIQPRSPLRSTLLAHSPLGTRDILQPSSLAQSPQALERPRLTLRVHSLLEGRPSLPALSLLVPARLHSTLPALSRLEAQASPLAKSLLVPVRRRSILPVLSPPAVQAQRLSTPPMHTLRVVPMGRRSTLSARSPQEAREGRRSTPPMLSRRMAMGRPPS